MITIAEYEAKTAQLRWELEETMMAQTLPANGPTGTIGYTEAEMDRLVNEINELNCKDQHLNKTIEELHQKILEVTEANGRIERLMKDAENRGVRKGREEAQAELQDYINGINQSRGEQAAIANKMSERVEALLEEKNKLEGQLEAVQRHMKIKDKWICDAVDNMAWMHQDISRNELGLLPGDELHIEGQRKIIAKLNSQRNLLEVAWAIIANSCGGNWDMETPDWGKAAAKWRDEYFRQMTPTQKGEYANPSNPTPLVNERDFVTPPKQPTI
jgi:DNA repair exonuclease SbcCD ATPase subunit